MRFAAVIKDIRFIQHTKTSTTSKKHIRGTVERSFYEKSFSGTLSRFS